MISPETMWTSVSSPSPLMQGGAMMPIHKDPAQFAIGSTTVFRLQLEGETCISIKSKSEIKLTRFKLESEMLFTNSRGRIKGSVDSSGEVVSSNWFTSNQAIISTGVSLSVSSHRLNTQRIEKDSSPEERKRRRRYRRKKGRKTSSSSTRSTSSSYTK